MPTYAAAAAAAAAGNTSPYIWAAWGYLESLTGNVARARKLFDAAIVVDETHAAAWHKWGMLEMRQGNYLRARCAAHVCRSLSMLST
jgi:tetratricopeptide (TPR) repeat protein